MKINRMTIDKAKDMLKQALSDVPCRFSEIEMYKDIKRYRERIFCYELYYRFRCLMEDEYNDDILHGELDKSGNKGFNNEIPDFVIHSPGNNDHNLVVVEVKVNPDEIGIKKDLNTLIKFMGCHKYQHGVLICVTNGRNRDKYTSIISSSWRDISCMCKDDVQSRISVLIKDNESVEYHQL